MDVRTILDILKNLPLPNSRITLYLNTARVREQYFQNGGLEMIETSDAINAETKGDIDIKVASIEGSISNTKGSKGELKISPLLMAILLEEDKKRNNLIVDPATSSSIPKGALLKRVSDTRLVLPSETVNIQTSKFSEDIANEVQIERDKQVKGYEELEKTRKTIVWGDVSRRNVASIVSTEFLNPDSFTSYNQGLLGILGLFEKEISKIRFIAPLWIWHEGFSHDKAK